METHKHDSVILQITKSYIYLENCFSKSRVIVSCMLVLQVWHRVPDDLVSVRLSIIIYGVDLVADGQC